MLLTTLTSQRRRTTLDAMPTETPTILTREQAAEYLGVTADTLAAHASRGTGPRYAKLSGRAVRYRLVDLDDWVESKLRRSTRDDASA
jgi:excisionase family DNA binding protein